MKRILTSLFLLLSSLTYADYSFPVSLDDTTSAGSNQIYVEPRLSRTNFSTTGVKQKGYLHGIKAGYDLLNYNSFYVGLESLYMRGTLKDGDIVSTYKDFFFEGKIGYTIGCPASYYITPYVGLGYEKQKNHYTNGSNHNLSYSYASLGFLSNLYLSPCFSLGCNFNFKFPFCGHQNIENECVDASGCICKKSQYFVEVPLTYWPSSAFAISVVPFFDYKNYNSNCIGEDWIANSKMRQFGLGFRGTFSF